MKPKKIHLNPLNKDITYSTTFNGNKFLYTTQDNEIIYMTTDTNIKNKIWSQKKGKIDVNCNLKDENIFASADKIENVRIWDINKIKNTKYSVEDAKKVRFNDNGHLCVSNYTDLNFLDLRMKFPYKKIRINGVKNFEFFNENILCATNYDGLHFIDIRNSINWTTHEESNIFDMKVKNYIFYTKNKMLIRIKNNATTEIKVCGNNISVFDDVLVVGGNNKLQYGFEKSTESMLFDDVGEIKNVVNTKNGKFFICGDKGIFYGFSSF